MGSFKAPVKPAETRANPPLKTISVPETIPVKAPDHAITRKEEVIDLANYAQFIYYKLCLLEEATKQGNVGPL